MSTRYDRIMSSRYNRKGRVISKRNKEEWGLAGKIIGGVLIVGVIVAISTIDSKPYKPAEDPKVVDAWYITKTFVKQDLKNPSGASFGGVFSDDFQRSDDVVVCVGIDTYKIEAWVEATNGFGATIRTDFTCEVTNTSGDRWTCNSLVFDK